MDSGFPAQMTAIEIKAFGAPEMLVAGARPVPAPQPGHVLIKVAAAGVNRPDVVQRQGNYPPPKGITDIPGLEVAGEIVALGADVHDWKVGDKVCALVAGGGYAQFVEAPAVQCLPIPRGFSMVEAAAIPETFFTVWVNLFDRGKLTAGETVLIHGGSSGIGTTAIQVAKAFGARVFVTAGSAEKCKACEQLGAERAINYREEDFVQVAKELTGGKGVNLIIDIVAGDYIAKNLETLAVEGRLVQVGVQKGQKAEVPVRYIMLKRLTWTGSTLRARPIHEKGEIAKALKQNIWPLFETGKIKPVIYKTLPLAQAADAHKLMEASTHIGKLVLTV
jgi:putative PIG3 family NAD(P)H quinone oxidoreductase